jgi:hypothetical protein
MKIEKTEVFGFKASLRGMRNPKESYNKSDSTQILTNFLETSMKSQGFDKKNYNVELVSLGKLDQKLSQQLVKAGDSHCKHLRLIQVWFDMTLPRYIWQEMDTYRHVEKVSCSTMHKLMSYDLKVEMFENGFDYMPDSFITELTKWIERYKETNNLEEKKIYKLVTKRLLPESFLQKRTMTTNYQQLLNMYRQRKNHELPEWHVICDWIIQLPYFTELTGIND